MAAKRFTATVVQDDRTSGCGVQLPFDPRETFGAARAPVKVSINGFEFRTTTCAMSGAYWIPMNAKNRAGAGVVAGDRIKVRMEPDTDPRVVEAPLDFAKALRASAPAREAWKKLSYSHQKEYVEAIVEARKSETRARRIAQAIQMIGAAKKR